MSTGTDVDIIGPKRPIIESISESHEVMTADPSFCVQKGQPRQTSARTNPSLQMNDLHLLTGQDGADDIHQYMGRPQPDSLKGQNPLQNARWMRVTHRVEKH
ncbi:MAG: hypothetical protein ACPGTU_18405 [Myxococcota bacterium]